MQFLALFVLVIAAVLPIAAGNSDRLFCVPALHAGQKFVYRVRYKTQKVTRAESRIATAVAPEEVNNDTERYVSVEINKVQGAGSNAARGLARRLVLALAPGIGLR